MTSKTFCLSLMIVCVATLGCGPQTLPGDFGPTIQFNDHPTSNATPDPSQLNTMVFTNEDGSRLRLRDIGGNKSIVLVISRGLVGSAPQENDGAAGKAFCLYCSTQTARLAANYSKFRDRHAEIVVVFPVARKEDSIELQTFAAKVQGAGKQAKDFPFPVVLDVELAAVNALGIRDDLSKPSTYIFDSDGNLRFGYVGQSISDRPSIQALLEQLDQINQ